MGYTILLRNGKYALLVMGNQYAVVSGYDPTQPVGQQWDYGTYLTHWNQSAEDKQIALFHAVEKFRLKKETNYIYNFSIKEIAKK